jgi:hypothetical protein
MEGCGSGFTSDYALGLRSESGRRTLEVLELPRPGLSPDAARALVREVATESPRGRPER